MLRWVARYEDGGTVTGNLPEHLPSQIERDGLRSVDLLHAESLLVRVELTRSRRFVFRRRVDGGFGGTTDVRLLMGWHDTETGATPLVELCGDGSLRLWEDPDVTNALHSAESGA